MRTKYILSELDNVEAGRPVQHRNQFQGVLDTCEFDLSGGSDVVNIDMYV